MTDVPEDEKNKFSASRLRYHWYVTYERSNEYEKNPEWTQNITTKTKEEDCGDDCIGTKKIYRVYNQGQSRKRWVESDTRYDLIQMR